MNANMKEFPISVDVLCLGIACYDLIFTVDRHVGADEKIRASDLTACGGGLAANAAMTVARLGYSVAFAGIWARICMVTAISTNCTRPASIPNW